LNGLIRLSYFAIPTLAVSYLLYRFGAWGGGDVKLLTALSVGVPFLSTDSFLPFFVNFLSNTLVTGMLFGIFWSSMLILKNFKKVSPKITRLDFLIIIVFFSISVYFMLSNPFYKIFSLLLVFLPLTYLTKKVENIIQVISKKVKDLEPGDWILKDIKVGRRTVKKTPIGLTKKDIKLLQKSRIKKIKIKDGIPFVPSFLLAFIGTLVYENIILNIVQNVITSI
jgi:prepilin signal peptidase PulO-like enzyme (type II secretory pathway)